MPLKVGSWYMNTMSYNENVLQLSEIIEVNDNYTKGFGKLTTGEVRNWVDLQQMDVFIEVDVNVAELLFF